MLSVYFLWVNVLYGLTIYDISQDLGESSDNN